MPATPPAIAPISSMKSADVSAPPAVDDDIVIVKEIVAKKFGEMTFSDYNSAEDEDFSLSEAETEDSLEWSSETERTRAEDDLVEEKARWHRIENFYELNRFPGGDRLRWRRHRHCH